MKYTIKGFKGKALIALHIFTSFFHAPLIFLKTSENTLFFYCPFKWDWLITLQSFLYLYYFNDYFYCFFKTYSKDAIEGLITLQYYRITFIFKFQISNRFFSLNLSRIIAVRCTVNLLINVGATPHVLYLMEDWNVLF